MCFDQKSSFGFASLGLCFAYYVHSRTNNTQLATGIFFFFLMELLQGFQYFVIDDCDNMWNKALTVLGFLHICCQPYFTHVINSSLTRSKKTLQQYDIVLKLSALGGAMLFGRFLISPWRHVDSDPQTEWLRGEKLCTYSGKVHLAWAVPMYEPTYYVPGSAIHFFLMFAPFFVMDRPGMKLQGVLLFLFGPFLASQITPNLQEQASVWCFFSIMQIGFLLFIVREHLIVNWGKNKDAAKIFGEEATTGSKSKGKSANGHANGHSNGTKANKKLH